MRLLVKIILFAFVGFAIWFFVTEPLLVRVDNAKALTPGGPIVKYIMVALFDVFLVFLAFSMIFHGEPKNHRASRLRIIFKHHGFKAALHEVFHPSSPARVSGFSLSERRTSLP